MQMQVKTSCMVSVLVALLTSTVHADRGEKDSDIISVNVASRGHLVKEHRSVEMAAHNITEPEWLKAPSHADSMAEVDARPFHNGHHRDVAKHRRHASKDPSEGDPGDSTAEEAEMGAVGVAMCCACWTYTDKKGTGEKWTAARTHNENTGDSIKSWFGSKSAKEKMLKPTVCHYGKKAHVCAESHNIAILAWKKDWKEEDNVDLATECAEMWTGCMDSTLENGKNGLDVPRYPSKFRHCLKEDHGAQNVGAFCGQDDFTKKTPSIIHSYLGSSQTCTAEAVKRRQDQDLISGEAQPNDADQPQPAAYQQQNNQAGAHPMERGSATSLRQSQSLYAGILTGVLALLKLP